MKRVKSILIFSLICSLVIMGVKMVVSIHYWMMHETSDLSSNFMYYTLGDLGGRWESDSIYDLVKFKFVPIQEIFLLTLFTFPYLIILKNIRNHDFNFVKQDFIIFRSTELNLINLGLRRLLTLIIFPLLLIVILSPLLISSLIIFFYYKRELFPLYSIQGYGLLCQYLALFTVIIIYSFFKLIHWVYTGFRLPSV